MFRTSTRVPSFSLIEMLVVLILSSIIAGIIYFAYYTVTTYQLNLQTKLRRVEDLNSLYFLLKTDMDRSEELYMLNEYDLRCIVPGDVAEVRYSFLSSYGLRIQNGRTDTFHCSFRPPVAHWKSEKGTAYPAKIDELMIEMENLPLPFTIHLYKQYDAAARIETIKNDTLP